jgi:hypothetical protein
MSTQTQNTTNSAQEAGQDVTTHCAHYQPSLFVTYYDSKTNQIVEELVQDDGRPYPYMGLLTYRRAVKSTDILDGKKRREYFGCGCRDEWREIEETV